MTDITSFVNSDRQIDRESSPLGPRLHLARRKSGLSLRKLAERVGTSHQTIHLIEIGQKYPDEALLKALSEALGVSSDEMTKPLDFTLRCAFHNRT